MDEYHVRNYLLNLLRTTPQMIKLNLEYNYEHLRERDLYFELKKYVDDFLKKCNPNKFFVIPGLRGVGKTTVLYQLYSYLYNDMNIDSNRILFLDLERLKDEQDLKILDFFDVFIRDINEEYYLTDTPLFIFVDEAQYDSKWASSGKIIFDENVNVFMIFTGFNALNLEYNADSARRLLKKPLYPLNFTEYLEIKHDINLPGDTKNIMYNLITSGDIKEAVKHEKKMQLKISSTDISNIQKDWERFLQYGSLPFALHKNNIDIIQETLDIKDRIIEKDLLLLGDLNTETRIVTYPLLKQLAMQKPGTNSFNSLSNLLGIDQKTVKNLLNTLEKTQIIFHLEKYCQAQKCIRSTCEYYFLATQIKAAYFLNNGDVTGNYKQYIGILLENLVASILFNLKESRHDGFGLYYDGRNGGVDFILKTFTDKAVPVEVGIGKKNKKQIIKAMNEYNSEYGIVISGKTDHIVKEDNIIFIPVMTFSFI